MWYIQIFYFLFVEYVGQAIAVNHIKILGDKINKTVRLGKLFNESSTGVPALLPCSQLPRQARATLRKLFT